MNNSVENQKWIKHKPASQSFFFSSRALFLIQYCLWFVRIQCAISESKTGRARGVLDRLVSFSGQGHSRCWIKDHCVICCLSMSLSAVMMKLQNIVLRSWRDGSVIRNTCYSSREHRVQLTTYVQWLTTSYNSSFRWTDMCAYARARAHTQTLKISHDLTIEHLVMVHFSSPSSGILLWC